MAEKPKRPLYLRMLEESAAGKSRQPSVPQRQAERFQIQTNTQAWERGIPSRYRAIDAKAHIMQRRAFRNYNKSQELYNQVPSLGRNVGMVSPNFKQATRLAKKSERQNAKAELYRMRSTAVNV